jgi:hypothetical protein
MIPVGLILLAGVAVILYYVISSNNGKSNKTYNITTNDSVVNNGYVLLFDDSVVYKYDKNGDMTTVSDMSFLRASCGLLNTRVHCAGGYPNTATTFSYNIGES